MACSRTGKRVINYKLSFFIFLSIFLTLHTTQSLYATIELFSLSYDDQGHLKINTLYRSIHDEEALKKEAEKTEFYKKLLEQHPQEIKKIKEETTKTEQNIEIKKAILQKIFLESNGK